MCACACWEVVDTLCLRRLVSHSVCPVPEVHCQACAFTIPPPSLNPSPSLSGAGVKVIEAHLTCLPSGSPQPVCNGATEPDSPSPEDSLSSGGEHSEDVATPSWLGEGRGQSASNSMESSAMQFDTDHYEGSSVGVNTLRTAHYCPTPLPLRDCSPLTGGRPVSPSASAGDERW